jgi:hypothetical protein
VQIFGPSQRFYLAGELLKSAGQQAFEGDFFWSRRGRGNGEVAAVAERLTLNGARLAAPVLTRFSGALEFTASRGSQSLPLQISTSLAGSVSGRPDVKLQFDRRTGLFRGEWKDAGIRRPFSGAMLSAEEGIGLFPPRAGAAGAVRVSLPGGN